MFKKYVSGMLMLSLSAVFLGHGSQEECNNQKDAFFAAVEAGDVSQAWKLLDENPGFVRAQHTRCMTALHVATRQNHMAIVVLLLCRGAEVNAHGFGGRTALHFAVEGGYQNLAKLLLQRGAILDARDSLQCTALNLVCAENDGNYLNAAQRYYLAMLLLSNGADVNARNDKGATPLHNAACLGDVDIVRLLILYDADVNAVADEFNRMPLHFAVLKKHSNVVEFLLRKGAIVYGQDKADQQPIHMASCPEIAELLIEYGAGVNARGPSGSTPLHIVAFTGNIPVAQFLIGHGAEINARNTWGETPLHEACRACSYAEPKGPMVQLLIESGANVDVQAGFRLKYTPLDSAVGADKFDAVVFLLQSGAFSDIFDQNQRTALQIAAVECRFAIAALLLEWGDAVDGVTAEQLNKLLPEWREIQVNAGIKHLELLGRHEDEAAIELPTDLRKTILGFLCQPDVRQRIVQEVRFKAASQEDEPVVIAEEQRAEVSSTRAMICIRG